MGLIDNFQRFRHSRGFGIHSPFAYRLVKEAICPQRGYVYYEELTPRLSHPLTAMAYRLSIFLSSHNYRLRIVNSGENPEGINPEEIRERNLNVSNPEPFKEDEALLLINPSPEVGNALISRLKSSGNGLAIEGRKYLLLIPRPEMAFVSYQLP